MTGNAITILKFPVALAVLCLLFAFTHNHSAKAHSRIKSYHHKTLKHIPEPSDIAFDKSTNHLFIVSDHGKLFECDTTGTIIRKALIEGDDFEGVEIKDSFIYVSDETPRKVYKYLKADLSLVNIYPVSWGGAMNKAYESITWNQSKKCFVLVGEQPAIIVEFDESFKELARHPFKEASCVSGARWYNGKLYLLNSMDACIYTCDPITYEVQESYTVNMLNPEGIAFDDAGKMLLVSDDAQALHYFNKLKTAQ